MRTPDGRKYGPISRQEMDAWFGEGRIDIDCQILCEGWEQWKWAADVYPQLEIARSNTATTAGILVPDSHSSLASASSPAIAPSDTPVILPETFAIVGSTPSRLSVTAESQAFALRPADRGWSGVEIGLAVSNLSLWAVFACLLCLIIAWAAGALPPIDRSATAAVPNSLMLLGVWGLIGLCGASVSLLAGWGVCLRVSKRSRAYSLILAAVACLGAIMPVVLLLSTVPLGVSQLLAPAERVPTLTWAGSVIVYVLSAAAVSLFGLFLGRLGAIFGDWGLNKQGTYFVTSQLATAIWFGAATLLLDSRATGVELLRITVSALLVLGNCYWLGSLVRRARRSLDSTQPAFESPGADGVQ